MAKKLAIIRIRGPVETPQKVEDALKSFGLKRKYSCAVVEESPSVLGALKKANYYLTYGVLDGETEKLLEKKGKAKVYRLNPPRKGIGRKGIKIAFRKSGSLGNRAEKINDMIKRML